MTTQTISGTDFNRDSGAAKRASEHGPVVITDRGKPSHVLLTWEDYQKLGHPPQTLAERLALEGAEDIDFDPPKVGGTPTAATFD